MLTRNRIELLYNTPVRVYDCSLHTAKNGGRLTKNYAGNSRVFSEDSLGSQPASLYAFFPMMVKLGALDGKPLCFFSYDGQTGTLDGEPLCFFSYDGQTGGSYYLTTPVAVQYSSTGGSYYLTTPTGAGII